MVCPNPGGETEYIGRMMLCLEPAGKIPREGLKKKFMDVVKEGMTVGVKEGDVEGRVVSYFEELFPVATCTGKQHHVPYDLRRYPVIHFYILNPRRVNRNLLAADLTPLQRAVFMCTDCRPIT